VAWKIPLSDIQFGQEEKRAVMDVLDSGWLTMGEVTQSFETAFSQYTGSKHCFAVANATVALHMACLGCGIKPGDEVIVPSLSFVATANAVRYIGATPVFAEICGENDLTISLEDMDKRVTPRTKAVMVMHYAGYACDMPNILDWAHQRGIVVIEDAAHAVGAYLNNKHMGTWGRAGCFSFFSNKNLSTGEGGMVITDDDDLAERFRLLRSHGMTSLTWDRHQGHAWSYDVVDLGYNYRIDEIHSALGIVQLQKLDENNARRKELSDQYRALINNRVPELGVPFVGHPGVSAYHIMPVILPEGIQRRPLMEKMRSLGIQTSIHYPPIHQFTSFKDSIYVNTSLPVTEGIARREVTLPLYPMMSDEQVGEVVEGVRQALRDSRE
jgi:dTDP-4-amino-4,6-dideoxygalactose transaminase